MGWFSGIINSIGDLGQSIIDVAVDVVEGVGDLVVSVVDVAVDVISDVVGWLVPDLGGYDQSSIDALDNKYKGVLVNKQSNIASIPVIYGQRKVGGTRVFMASSGTDNEYLYIVLILCEGEIHSIDDVYINDVLSSDSKFSGLVTINKHLGSDSQAADSTLVAGNVGWTSNHKLSGVAYLGVRLKWDQSTFGGVPTIHAVVQGKKVYDPRTSTTATSALSSNPALCLRDYLTNVRYGKGLTSSFIDDGLFIAAANKCDALVTPYSGGSNQKIFECNAVIDTGKSVLSNARNLLSGMRGLMPFREGKYSLIIEDQGSSVFDFDESHIIGGLSIQSESKKTKFNRVIATFPNPNANWQMDQIEYPVAGSAEEQGYLTEDGGVELHMNLDLPSTTNIYTAQDIAKMALLRSRNGLILSFTSTSEALNVSVGDIISVTHSTPVWDKKPFRVLKLSLNSDGTVGLSLVEHQDSIYPWSSKTQADDIPDTNLPDPFSVIAPGIPSVNEEIYVTKSGAGVKAKAVLGWVASTDAFVNKYEIQHKLSGSSKYIHSGESTDTDFEVLDIAPGSYYFRVRSLNALGVPSEWSETLLTEISGLSEPPLALENFSAQNVSSLTILTWDQSEDIDVRIGGHIEVRHSSLIAGAGWSTSVSVGNSILNGTSTLAVLPFQIGTYIVRATDSSGIQSEISSVVTLGDTVQAFANVDTLQAHPLFLGTHDDTVLDGNIIKLEGQNDIDDWVGNIDDIAAFDVGDGGIDTGGTYTFASGIDAGSVKRQQLKRHIKSTITQPLNLVDSRGANIDEWDDWDGTNTASGDCKVYVRHTEDDPSSSPTWSAWELLNVNEYNKRAFEFKATLTVNDPAYNIEIEELSITAQETA